MANFHHDPTRSTSIGYWHLARQYLCAAEAVRSTDKQLMFPTLQLYGQAIELALKAFLLKRGLPLDELKKLSHDLEKILDLSRRRRLGTEVKLSRTDLLLIKLLNMNYAATRFRYIVTGPTRVPEINLIASICFDLLNGLEQYCANTSWGVHCPHK